MNAALNHLQFNIDYKNVFFYKKLLQFLGWEIIGEWGTMIGFNKGDSVSLWFSQTTKNFKNDRDGDGLNHLGIKVSSIAEVDEVARFLKKEKVVLLYGTPRPRPEFSEGDNTYYQIMFDSPDKILIEVMYSGPKNL